ncbi:MAG TPA: AraC family transcriptional regulator [Bryobacteraceae bacterium]|jgi:AraC-like DNA-binding protein
MLEQQADKIAAPLTVADPVVIDVRRVLARRLAKGEIQIESVARALLTSTRSLQRRLASAGVSYQQVVDGARQEAADRYLSSSTLSIEEIAYLLGYSEPAAFHRAFRRWKGITPQAFRAGQNATP